ncbi:MAG: hypothetical protein ABJC12_02920 [Saprospiraceae bacterium]
MKLILFVFLFLIPGFIIGQSSKNFEFCVSLNSIDPYLPVHLSFEEFYIDGGKFINNSLAYGLTGKYFLTDYDAIRLRVVYTNKNVTDVRDVTTDIHSIVDEKFHQILLKVAPGFQWQSTKEKMVLFGGLEVPITFIGNLKQKEYGLYATLDETTYNETVAITTIPGGFSAGIGAFFGSNFFITNKLGLGFEFGSAFQYSSVGGTITNIVSLIGTSGNSMDTSTIIETLQQYKFSPFQGSINLTMRI